MTPLRVHVYLSPLGTFHDGDELSFHLNVSLSVSVCSQIRVRCSWCIATTYTNVEYNYDLKVLWENDFTYSIYLSNWKIYAVSKINIQRTLSQLIVPNESNDGSASTILLTPDWRQKRRRQLLTWTTRGTWTCCVGEAYGHLSTCATQSPHSEQNDSIIYHSKKQMVYITHYVPSVPCFSLA